MSKADFEMSKRLIATLVLLSGLSALTLINGQSTVKQEARQLDQSASSNVPVEDRYSGGSNMMEDSDYRILFQNALSNTLHLTTCHFNAHVVSEGIGPTDHSEIYGDYIAQQGAFLHQKTMNYEFELLWQTNGIYMRYQGENWRLLRRPGQQEPPYKIPILMSIPVFQNLANTDVSLTSASLQVIDDRTFYRFAFVDATGDEQTLSRDFYIARDAPDYITRIDAADYLTIRDDDSIATIQIWPSTSVTESTQSSKFNYEDRPRSIGTTTTVRLSAINDPMITLPVASGLP